MWILKIVCNLLSTSGVMYLNLILLKQVVAFLNISINRLFKIAVTLFLKFKMCE